MKSSIWIPLACFLAGSALASVGFFFFSSSPSPERAASIRPTDLSAPPAYQPSFSASLPPASPESPTASASSLVASAYRVHSADHNTKATSGFVPSGGTAYPASSLSSRTSDPQGASLPSSLHASSPATSSFSASTGAAAPASAVVSQAPASAVGFAQQVYASGNIAAGGVTLPLALTPNLESSPVVTDQQLAEVDDAANQFLEQVQNDPAPTSSDDAQASWDRAAAANDDLLRAKLGWAGYNALSIQSAITTADQSAQ